MKIISVKKQGGAIAVLLAVVLPLLIGFMALAIDIGSIVLNRQRMQIAADSAAIVAAGALQHGLSIESAQIFAQQATADNGFENHLNIAQIDVAIPPGGTDTFSTDMNFVRVTITQPMNVFLAWIFGIVHIPTSAMAVSGPAGNGLPCMMTLASTVSGALTVGGSGVLTASTCGVYVNSNNTDALKVFGKGSLLAKFIQVVGSFIKTGSGQISHVLTGAELQTDPFALLPMPLLGPCMPLINEKAGAELFLQPGTYCGGIKLNKSSIVHFSAGIYILNDGGMNVNGNVSLIGNDVTFFNTGTLNKKGYDSVKLEGTGVVNLAAPKTGVYAGMLLIQDPLNTKEASITGNSGSNWAGNFYLPSANLNLKGNGETSIPMGTVVASTVNVSGNATITLTNAYGGVSGTGTMHTGLYQ